MHTYYQSKSNAAALQTSEERDTELDKSETPIQRVGLLIGENRRDVYLKLEGYNPGGSIKHRTAFALLRQLESTGQLRKGGRLIESSSGNLAISLAMLSRERGYQFTAVVDPMVSEEKIQRIHDLGGEMIMVEQPDENGGYLINRLARIREMLAEDSELLWTDQYHNPANPEAHYSGIAPEIYQQLGKKVDAVFVAVSTGGTLAGVGRYFREKSPNTHIIAVDAKGSIALGGFPRVRKLSGIGSSRRSRFVETGLYDELIFIEDAEAFSYCRTLEATTGIMIGGSSGACLAACAQYLAQHKEIQRGVCICADHGKFYASSIFSDSWLEENRLELGRQHLGLVSELTI